MPVVYHGANMILSRKYISLENLYAIYTQVIKGYIDEVSVPTLIEEEWKETAMYVQFAIVCKLNQ